MERQGKIRPALFSGLPKLSAITEWPAADKCLLVALVLIPFAFSNALLAQSLLDAPLRAPYFDRAFLPFFRNVQVGVGIFWATLSGIAALARRYRPQSQILVHATVQVYSLNNTFLIYSLGTFTNTLPLVLPAAIVIGGLLFGTRVTVAGLITSVASLTLLSVAERWGYLSYAPVLSGSPVVGRHLDSGWLFIVGVPSLITLAATMLLAGYFLWSWRARGQELLDAKDTLELRVEERTRQLSHANATLQAEIHRRQELEDQLRQSAKMEAVGRFTGGIAHDFNNVLTIIDGYTSLLLLRMKSGTKDFEDISHLAKGTLRARDLAKKLLAFSRKEAVQMRPLDLNTVLNAMRGLVARAAGEAIRVRFELGDGLNPIRADPGQLEQILLNLAVNARDAMPGNGEISIRTQAVTRGAEGLGARNGGAGPEPYVLLSVSDTGMGMDAETIEKIFDPFFTTKDVGKGTGLGLSTVYGIVQQSGGHIEVASEIGKGTEFKLYFPMAESAQLPTLAAPETAAAPRRGTETILAVEDEPALLMLIRQVLQNLGYRVLAAGSPRDACELAQEHAGKINLLLTDLVMPWMNGRELAQRLRLASPGLRVIFTSGYTADAAILAEIREMKVPFLPKPFQPDELGRKVREVLDAEAP